MTTVAELNTQQKTPFLCILQRTASSLLERSQWKDFSLHKRWKGQCWTVSLGFFPTIQRQSSILFIILSPSFYSPKKTDNLAALDGPVLRDKRMYSLGLHDSREEQGSSFCCCLEKLLLVEVLSRPFSCPEGPSPHWFTTLRQVDSGMQPREFHKLAWHHKNLHQVTKWSHWMMQSCSMGREPVRGKIPGNFVQSSNDPQVIKWDFSPIATLFMSNPTFKSPSPVVFCRLLNASLQPMPTSSASANTSPTTQAKPLQHLGT